MAQATATRRERPKRLPMTGAQYLEGLRDGREIWINGERVSDVTTLQGFATEPVPSLVCTMRCMILNNKRC